MTQRDLNKVKTKIKRWLKIWIPLLELDKWTIHTKYANKVPEGYKASEGWDYLALSDSKWEYLESGIDFYLEPCYAVSDYDLESTIVHELLHVVLAEMSVPKNTKHEERVISILTKALMKARYTNE